VSKEPPSGLRAVFDVKSRFIFGYVGEIGERVFAKSMGNAQGQVVIKRGVNMVCERMFSDIRLARTAVRFKEFITGGKRDMPGNKFYFFGTCLSGQVRCRELEDFVICLTGLGPHLLIGIDLA